LGTLQRGHNKGQGVVVKGRRKNKGGLGPNIKKKEKTRRKRAKVDGKNTEKKKKGWGGQEENAEKDTGKKRARQLLNTAGP